MNIYVFLKVFADLCLYFGCIGALPALFPYSFSFLWPALVCAASASIAAFLSDHGHSKARFPFLILAASCLILAGTVLEGMILIPPIAYVFTMIFRDEWTMEYFHFRESFRKTLILLVIILLMVHFGVKLETREVYVPMLDSTPLLYCTLIYAACGIILQRQLRLGNGSARDKYLNNVQLALLTIGTAAFLAGLIAAERFLTSQGISLIHLIAQIVRTAIALPLSILGYLFTRLMEVEREFIEIFEERQNMSGDATVILPMPDISNVSMPESQEPLPFPWWLAILVLVILTCVLIMLTRVLRSRTDHMTLRETVTTVLPKAKQKQGPRRSNRSKLRRIYREFLKTEKRKGRKLHTWYTSQDILEGTSPSCDTEAAGKLRSLYLSARYDLNRDITAEQVQSAKNALKQYKSE